MNWNAILKTISAAVCAFAGFLWGELDGLMLALIAFMTINYITSLIVGYQARKLSSHTGFLGISRKELMLRGNIYAKSIYLENDIRFGITEV